MARFDKNKFRTESQTWETPDSLFKLLNVEFNFDIDLSASEENTKCKKFISEKMDALSISWKGCGWLNPPYGGASKNSLKNWVKKAFEETRKEGCKVVMLIPARTNTEWWHKYCMQGEIRYLKGRLKFKGRNTKGELVNYPATFGNVVVIFRKLKKEVRNSSHA